MWNCHRFWFLTLGFPRDVTQFSRISRGENLFSLEFLKNKSKNFRGAFSEKYNSTLPVWIFSGIAQRTSEFNPKSQIIILCDNFSMAIAIELFQKKSQTEGRVEDMKCLGGILKKYNVEIPGV